MESVGRGARKVLPRQPTTTAAQMSKTHSRTTVVHPNGSLFLEPKQ
jgi:hypothetical protein